MYPFLRNYVNEQEFLNLFQPYMPRQKAVTYGDGQDIDQEIDSDSSLISFGEADYDLDNDSSEDIKGLGESEELVETALIQNENEDKIDSNKGKAEKYNAPYRDQEAQATPYITLFLCCKPY